MNAKQKQMLINQAMTKVRPNSRGRKYINAVMVNPTNTYAHEKAKFDECWKLSKKGIDFLTEAIFENRQRADIVALDVEGEGVYCVEILHSETEARFEKKEYPFPIIKIYVEEE